MASKQPADLQLTNWRGGANDTDPPHSLPDNQVVQAVNVEFWLSTIGERRQGTQAVDLTNSGLTAEAFIAHLGNHIPLEATAAQTNLWAIAATASTSSTFSYRDQTYSWFNVNPVDAPINTIPTILQIKSQTLHGKWFVAYRSAVDRLHVWDGARLRRVGIAPPLAGPVVVDDTANPGTFSGTRQYYVRFIEMSGTTILRRSEPSPTTTFTPAGIYDGAIVTEPALVNEYETHWELYASDGDGFFWLIATTPIATTTFTDTNNPGTTYANVGPLSDDIGNYTVPNSCKFVVADQDRLIMANNWEQPEQGSRVSWTPVWASEGFGNDERIPVETDNFVDLDWQTGGDITGVSAPIAGSFYVFKYNRVYKMQRTGRLDQAYESFLLSSTRGAIYGSIVDGIDEYGRGCVYFLDPQAGPCRISSSGLQFMRNMRNTWLNVNTSASTVVCHGVYYPDKQQVHWWLSTGTANTPSFKLISQINNVQSDPFGTNGGFTTANGAISRAYCSTIIPEIITNSSGIQQLSFRPYTGYLASDQALIQRCDTGATDNGQGYKAKILSKPYLPAGLLNKWGVMVGAMLATININPNITLKINLIRDFGQETSQDYIIDFVPDSNETLVIKKIDNFSLSDSRAIQVMFSDP